MDLDGMVGGDFEQGLAKLNEAAEPSETESVSPATEPPAEKLSNGASPPAESAAEAAEQSTRHGSHRY